MNSKEEENNPIENNFNSTVSSSEIPVNFWSCPKCGENNLANSHFCRQCGEKNIALSEKEEIESDFKSKIQHKKNITFFLIAVLIIGGLMATWHFGKESREKKEAQKYLFNESKSFSDSIALINNLSTEKEIVYKNSETKESFLERLEEEKDNSEKAIFLIKSYKENNNRKSTGEKISNLDALLKRYYEEAEKKVDVYNKYVSYEREIVNLDIEIDKEIDKIDTIFRNSADLKDVARSIMEMKKTMEIFSNQYQQIIPPAGLEEAHNKDAAILQKMINSLDVVASGIEKSNTNEILRGEMILNEAFSEKNINEIGQLRDYYFNELHNEFNDLRQRADNTRSELIKYGVIFEANIITSDIEGW
jgi:predicted RNA-binding Zn-ribbon protein involved in translation (DUF1610 family)